MHADNVFRQFFVVLGETRRACLRFSEERIAAHSMRLEYAKMHGADAVWATDSRIIGLIWPDGQAVPGEWRKHPEEFITKRVIIPDTRTLKGRDIAKHLETFAVMPDASEFTERIGSKAVFSQQRILYASYEFRGGLCIVQVPEGGDNAVRFAGFPDGIRLPLWVYSILRETADPTEFGDGWKECLRQRQKDLESLIDTLNVQSGDTPSA